MKKYSVSKWFDDGENSIFTKQEILDIYNDRRQGEGLPKIYTLKLMSICEDIEIKPVAGDIGK